MASDPSSWTISRLAPALGARVDGFDASRATLDELDAIAELLDEHLVLVLTEQHELDEAGHVAFSSHFGEPYVHPHLNSIPEHPAILEVLKTEHDTETFGGEFWHADITFCEPPAAVSVLRSLELPPLGGDTLFANQHLAYDRLSSGMQELLEPLSAHHVYPGFTEEDDGQHAVHPMVRDHPRTGRKALFVNPAFVHRIEGMTEAESEPILHYLFAHQTQPEFQLRVNWQPGQVTLWDNRATQHYAMNDYPGQRRSLHRVTAMERASKPT